MKNVAFARRVKGFVAITVQNRFFAIVAMAHRILTNAPAMEVEASPLS
jgi:hypothetical protein